MENYEAVCNLGSGSCGTVILVRNQKTKMLCALKKIQLDESKPYRTKASVMKEANILAKLKHPHIVSYHESFFDVDEKCLNIVQDYCDGGTLEDKIIEARSKKKNIAEEQIMRWFVQVVMAAQHMHSKKILHRDLKSQNVFLTKKGVVKLGDFGISKALDTTVDQTGTVVGTPCYLSPELCDDIPYSSKADVWAIGCLLYEMCALRPAFDAQNLMSLFRKIASGEYQPLPDHVSEPLKDLIKYILNKSPDDRPSASAILNHTCVQEHLAMFIEEKEYLLKQKENQQKLSPLCPKRPINKCESNSNNGYSATIPKQTGSSVVTSDSGVGSSVVTSDSGVGSSVVTSDSGVGSSVVTSDSGVGSSVVTSDSGVGSSVVTSDSGVGSSVVTSDSGVGSSVVTSDSGVGSSVVTSDSGVGMERPVGKDAHEEDVTGEVSDYSDDFDSSGEEEDIPEAIEECTENEPADGSEADHCDDYADDFEEDDSDLDEIVTQAKEAQSVGVENEYVVDEESDYSLTQKWYDVLGEDKFEEMRKIICSDITVEDQRFSVHRTAGEDSVEVCYLTCEQDKKG